MPEAKRVPLSSPGLALAAAEIRRADTTVQVHVDDSLVPKLSRLGEHAVQAFDVWLANLAAGQALAQAREPSTLDHKWHVYTLTDGLEVRAWWLAPDLVYVWDVLPVDSATAVDARTQCIVDPMSGALRVVEYELALDDTSDSDHSDIAIAPFTVAVSSRDLRSLGASDALIQRLKRVATPAALEQLRPQVGGDESVLLGYGLLARGVALDRVQRVLARLPRRAFDPSDYRAALHRTIDSGRIRVLPDADDIADALEAPWSHWMTYLHPEQRAIAEHPRYAGPAKVTGGPGTGKTIVAVHRVRWLLQEEGGLDLGEMPALLTSFVTSTVHQLELLADALLNRQQRQRVHVAGVDKLCAKLLRGLPSVHREFAVVSDSVLASRFLPVLRRHGLDLTPADAVSIWENVVLAAQDPSWAAVRALRQGVGLAEMLDAGQYAQFLDICREVELGLLSSRETTFLLLLREAVDLLPADSFCYRYIVVDEAQDLHPLHWRLLRQLAPRKANDMFLVGDGGQRLYRRPYALSQCGIETRNRSKVLRLSYRSSQEILDFANALLGSHSVDDMDVGEPATPRDRAVFSSTPPQCVGFETRRAELAAVVPLLREWRHAGLAWGEIMIAAPSNALCAEILDSLDWSAIPGRVLSTTTAPRPDAVSLVTYYRAKGLEARAVLVVGAGRSSSSAAVSSATTSSSMDDAAARERRALYVACTRARERLTVTWTGAPCDPLVRAIASGARSELGVGGRRTPTATEAVQR